MSDTATGGGLPDDAITRRLGLLAETLERELGPTARVERGDLGSEARGHVVALLPARVGAMSVSWIDDGEALNLYAGMHTWRELGRDLDAVAYVEDVVRSIIAGRVHEVLAPARSRLVVTLPDGSCERTTSYDGLGGCLPLPLWSRWGRPISYAPYTGHGGTPTG